MVKCALSCPRTPFVSNDKNIASVNLKIFIHYVIIGEQHAPKSFFYSNYQVN